MLTTVQTRLNAQKTKVTVKAKTNAVTTKAPMVFACLGKRCQRDGKISKTSFDSLLKEGIIAKDSAGKTYAVDGFSFSYGERNLYEDSIGKLIILTDFLTEFCIGDTITPAVRNNIFYKTKAGDTAYFDQIKIVLPDGRKQMVKPLRYVLTK
ncbi:MAG: hypothetical protein JSS78_10115 [Bacteroidetes bacterium]|nr:hypothetical protein [Bacteroidota bacterium]